MPILFYVKRQKKFRALERNVERAKTTQYELCYLDYKTELRAPVCRYEPDNIEDEKKF